MKLASITKGLSVTRSWIEGSVDITDLAYDSRQVKSGMLFFAIVGEKEDGHDYIHSAIDSGAIAIVVERWQEGLPESIAQIQVDHTRVALSAASVVFFEDPSSKLSLIGVTGTNGKTTTSYLIEGIFRDLGQKTGLIGTLEYLINGKSFLSMRTTPESYDLQRILHSMVGEGIEVVVMEVSSHASIMGRIDGCKFDAFIFTNLSQDHLDFHTDMDDYFQAKARLFNESIFQGAKHIVNIDDVFGKRLCDASKNCIAFGFSKDADVRCTNVLSLQDGIKISIDRPYGELDIFTGLKGTLNSENVLAAIATAYAFSVDIDVIKTAMSVARNVPGRFEEIEAGQDFKVVVDYAHTPDGLKRVLEAAKNSLDGRLITVFGCGGDRDRDKRPLMGKEVSKVSDISIVTSDNPRNEDPEKIIEDILEGVEERSGLKVISDRHQAIKVAIKEARNGDLVLIAGKGHETGQTFADRTIPFDDRLVALEILKEAINDTSKSA